MNFDEIKKLKEQILPILNKHGITKASLFGSYAKGTFTENSDVDILVYDVPKDIDIIDFVSIKHELEDKLQKKVDLVEAHTLKSTVRDEVLGSHVQL